MDRRALLGLAAVTAAAASPALASGGASTSRETYLKLPVVTATIMYADGRRGVLSVETGIDTADAALFTRAQQSVPRLRAAYATVAQRVAAGIRPGMPPNIDQLANELQTATNTVLGRGGARVLLGTVMAI